LKNSSGMRCRNCGVHGMMPKVCEMQSTNKMKHGLSAPQSRFRTVTINFAAYAFAALIIFYLARGILIAEFENNLAQARLAIFVPAALLSVVFWIIGDTLMYARL
jgi:hypothetical protein